MEELGSWISTAYHSQIDGQVKGLFKYWSYHSSIGMPACEILYGRKCRTPVLRRSWDRQNSYVDKHRRIIEFQVRDIGLLKVSLWKGSVTYRIELPEELNGIHDTFHVLYLRKCLTNESVYMPLEDLEIYDKMKYVEKQITILTGKSTSQDRYALGDQIGHVVKQNQTLCKEELGSWISTAYHSQIDGQVKGLFKYWSYHSSIGMPAYEILYGRKCRTPVLRRSWDRQNSYVDKHRRIIEFQVRDIGLLKVSLWKGSVTYRIELPEELNGIHDTFHVLYLRKCLTNESVYMPLEDLEIYDKMKYVEKQITILTGKSTSQDRYALGDQIGHVVKQNQTLCKIPKTASNLPQILRILPLGRKISQQSNKEPWDEPQRQLTDLVKEDVLIATISSFTGAKMASNHTEMACYAVLQSWVSKKFMTGCVVLFPVAVTFFVTWWIVQFFDGFFSPIYERLGVEIFGLGFLTSLIFIFFVGIFASSWMGATVFWVGEWFIKKMPFVKHIYSASKQISAAISPELEMKTHSSVTDQNTTAFKEVAIIRHPRLGEYAIGFITSSVVLQVVFSGYLEIAATFAI
ncbi:hypothetical protein E3N88_22369 [Mikania micrantha]|uniref:Tf2-1-like SH3-like domain-containing protein n=1 Tax=Mikania micrantha TaxID=192012 RepID=A0A5N6NCT6_9ASTR|nr:hypothetical protein E3N88_22369 [Mikania micrantha]